MGRKHFKAEEIIQHLRTVELEEGKRWQENYPKTERAKEETESLKKSGVKDALQDFF